MKLTTGFAIFALFSAAALMTSGCVSSGTYQAKEQESIQLSRNLEETKGAYQELEEKNKKLTAEGEALNAKLKKLDTEIAEFRSGNGQLKIANDKCKLENERLSLAAKPENLLKTLGEAFADLQAENDKLKQSLVSAEKDSAKKYPQPPVKLNPLVTKPVVTGEDGSAYKAQQIPETGKESAQPPEESPEKPVELKKEESLDQVPVIDDNLPRESPAELK